MRLGTNRVFLGVCSGLADQFKIEPIWLRLAFVLAFLMYGAGVLIYLILALLMHLNKS